MGVAARFCYPRALAISPGGSALFVTDQGNRKIWRVAVATGEVTTIAGSGEEGGADGVGDAAEFDEPAGIAQTAAHCLWQTAATTTRSGGLRWRRER